MTGAPGQLPRQDPGMVAVDVHRILTTSMRVSDARSAEELGWRPEVADQRAGLSRLAVVLA